MDWITGLNSGEMLLYGGVLLIAAAFVFAGISGIILRLVRKKLDKVLDNEYGKI